MPLPTPVPGQCATGTVGRTVPADDGFRRAVANAGRRVVRLPARTIAFDDFTPANGTLDGGVVLASARGIVGAGVGRTVFEVAPGTSTRAGDIPTGFPNTNQLSVLKVDGDRTVLRGFAVQGTDQGHLYNGLRVDHGSGLRASQIRVAAIPGDAASPPGETFGINDYRTAGSQWSDVVVDGAGVGASGFGVNNSTDITICSTLSKQNRYGMGFAFWQSSGVRCIDCRAIGNGRAGFNFERVTGSNELVRPVAIGNAYGVRISNDLGTGTFRIVDPPLTDGHFVVTLPYRYNGRPNLQKASGITLIVGGKPRPDLLRIERY
ncbi:hypothetical protein [Amnibacterium kyonggiense]|uniref:hypothetical protein n=1 Tax=Amnibacterium kyonggiense TaxID=595671 RepID=UPI00105D6D5C|nr:hypothetical protein [Amnibacterium kyonggiense]